MVFLQVRSYPRPANVSANNRQCFFPQSAKEIQGGRGSIQEEQADVQLHFPLIAEPLPRVLHELMWHARPKFQVEPRAKTFTKKKNVLLTCEMIKCDILFPCLGISLGRSEVPPATWLPTLMLVTHLEVGLDSP